MQIGFTTTTFRNIRNIEKIVEIAVTTGVDCIEWGGDIHVRKIETAKHVKKLCDDAKIGICSYGSYYRVGSCNEKEWQKSCKIASAMGASSVRVWLGKTDSEKTDDVTYTRLVKDAKVVCNIASEYGLIVCSECHDNTYNNNTDAFLKIRNDVNCNNFRTYFQSRYKKKAYDLDRIERTAPFTESVHISYSELFREQFPKYDPTYMDALLDKILEVGFDGNILLEYTYIFSYLGITSSMRKDIIRIKQKLGEKK